jgi:LysR family nitrogen assimilation transcriptional regulator
MNSATVAVRETLIELIAEHIEHDSWQGVTMRKRGPQT